MCGEVKGRVEEGWTASDIFGTTGQLVNGRACIGPSNSCKIWPSPGPNLEAATAQHSNVAAFSMIAVVKGDQCPRLFTSGPNVTTPTTDGGTNKVYNAIGAFSGEVSQTQPISRFHSGFEVVSRQTSERVLWIPSPVWSTNQYRWGGD